ncbi:MULTISPECIES: HAD family hydrolase [Pacificibacter]|uniref:HAD family hydrolase n=1 Tax=Pacificibacter TaxID=1042323 RepID=UPI001C08F5A3|nr:MULTISPECIES: HAD family hydrolase [Pacificibacter]MBU2937433.1 HAD family hydrolase [Pacificibacter marinus]MDO6615612.1 HAD family hydrolase [Pacificibacter sp. 1_MG-2023]
MDITSVRAILFDKDGTLFDFQKSWSPWAAAVIDRLAQDDAAVAQAVAGVLGFDIAQGQFLADGFAVSSTPDEQIERLKPIFPDLSEEDILTRMMSKMDVAVPVPVRDLDRSLQIFQTHQIKMGVVTNDFEQVGRDHLQHAGVQDAFDVVIGFDSGFGSKPAPDGCLAAAMALGVDPARTVMVGDSLHDLRAGRAAGMQTIGVLTGTASRADLTPWADIVVQDVAEIAAFFA